MSEVRSHGRRAIGVRPFVTGVLAVLGASGAAAQVPSAPTSLDSLPIGAHVRGFTSTTGVSIEGYVRGTSADTIRIGECKQCDPGTPVSLSTLRYLQVERRRHRIDGGRVAVYMGIGLFAGVVAGAGAGAIYAHQELRHANCGGGLCGLAWLAVPFGAAIGGATGLVGGGIVGLAHRESYWVGVRLPVPPR